MIAWRVSGHMQKTSFRQLPQARQEMTGIGGEKVDLAETREEDAGVSS